MARSRALQIQYGFQKGHSRSQGEGNARWKGDAVGYSALHSYIKRRKLKTSYCEKCSFNPPYDLANISQEYKRDLSDWEWLCRSCHATSDGRVRYFQGIKPYSKQNRRTNKKCLTCKKDFSIIISVLNRPGRGKFCSRLCSDKGRGGRYAQ